MKKFIIPSFLIVSLTISAQFIENRSFNFGKILNYSFNSINHRISNSNFYSNIIEIEEEEADEPFEFSVNDYLPENFDPFNMVYVAYANLYDKVFEEADEPFEFDTNNYLPYDFNPLYTEVNFDEYYEINQEADEAFEFNTKDYLPIGFNTDDNTELLKEYNRINEEADEPFDFDTKDYLARI